MTPNDGLKPLSINIWSRQATGIQQHFLDISGEGISIPNAEMENFMSSQKQVFEVQGRKSMVNAGNPLRHSHVIRVLRFELKFEQCS
jgi:hypothetical protein